MRKKWIVSNADILSHKAIWLEKETSIEQHVKEIKEQEQS